MNPAAAIPLTTRDVSRLLHVDLTTVINWCEQGKLKAYRTPGGHRRVQPENFMDFLKAFKIPVPPRFEERMKGGLKILVVDDEAGVRSMVVKAFKKNFPGALLSEAEDGFEAGKLTLDMLPDLVILDLNLPGVDGFKVCASIRQDGRFKGTRILAITGQDTPEYKAAILRAGADDYLPKPFETKDLLDKSSRLLDLAEG